MNQNELILKVMEKIDHHYPKYHKLKRYYSGDHDILHEPKKNDPTKSDMRAYFNYCRKMVQNSVGYILGKPVNYTSKSDTKEFLDLIDYYFSPWEKEHNINLKLQSAIHGKAYEVSFINKNGEFQCAYFSPLEMAVIYDGSVDSRVSLAVRKYKVAYDDTQYVDVWDNTNYYRYSVSGSEFTELEKKPHRFSRCPVRKLKNNDNDKSTFADIINIVDMYNSLHSISVQEAIDFRNAYLIFKGAKLEEEEAQKMKENGIIMLPHEHSDGNWLTKDPNSQFFKDLLTNLKDEIYIQSGQVNLNESFQSNTSGVAIRLKLQELENQSAIQESIFEKVLKDRLEFFCEWLSLYKSKQFDVKDINITFTRNVPVDELSIVQTVKDLQGIVPQEELLARLPFITNPSASIEKLKQEQDGTNLLGGLNG